MWPFKKKEDTSVIVDERLLLKYLKKDICPDCKTKGQWLVGPCGGIAQNIMCGNCHSRFNITPFCAERI